MPLAACIQPLSCDNMHVQSVSCCRSWQFWHTSCVACNIRSLCTRHDVLTDAYSRTAAVYTYTWYTAVLAVGCSCAGRHAMGMALVAKVPAHFGRLSAGAISSPPGSRLVRVTCTGTYTCINAALSVIRGWCTTGTQCRSAVFCVSRTLALSHDIR